MNADRWMYVRFGQRPRLSQTDDGQRYMPATHQLRVGVTWPSQGFISSRKNDSFLSLRSAFIRLHLNNNTFLRVNGYLAEQTRSCSWDGSIYVQDLHRNIGREFLVMALASRGNITKPTMEIADMQTKEECGISFHRRCGTQDFKHRKYKLHILGEMSKRRRIAKEHDHVCIYLKLVHAY